MQGKGAFQILHHLFIRITPAYAGKRHAVQCCVQMVKDHPRMCGEKPLGLAPAGWPSGSPPHVRGKVDSAVFHLGSLWDHPRMCGEKSCRTNRSSLEQGSPPHVRGKVFARSLFFVCSGITPACAGKSDGYTAGRTDARDHPRMCGEKDAACCLGAGFVGSPPHVRGKALRILQHRRTLRITPACAGKRLKRSRSTVPPVAIVPLFPSVCNKPVVSDGSPAGRDAPLFLPAENAVPASPAYNLRSL